MSGEFVWYELLTSDPKAAIAFYSEVIGWKTEAFGDPSMNYNMWVGSEGPLGGVMQLPEEAKAMGAPPHWMSNVTVDNLDASLAKLKELGGKVYNGPNEIPTVGRFAVVADPQGATLSLFQPAGDGMKAPDPAKQGHFCWSELATSDHNAAFNFYSALLGWEKKTSMDMGPMGTYEIFGKGDKQLGGMFIRPKEMPANVWMYYTSVDDLEAASGRATRHGAKLVNGPMDVPGGRISQFVDPQGAFFALHQAAAK